MSIEAETARLAGLQIDLLQKLRKGQITLDQWEKFNNLSSGDREKRFGDWKKPSPAPSAEPTEKFALLVDLGIITVPDDYDHATQLATFLKRNREKLYDVNNDITDKNFQNPSRILRPGDKLLVRAFKQIVSGLTTSEERMAFLRTQNAVFVGAQGSSLIFDQKRDRLPKGYWYCSFDKKERLFKDADGYRRVPSIYINYGGAFLFHLGYFECTWSEIIIILCFSDFALEA